MLQTFTLPAGTVCKRGGIPFVLVNATLIECHPDNWPDIRDGFKPEVADQTLVCSQSLQDFVKPSVAQDAESSATTSSSSLASSAGDSKSLT